MSSLRRPYVLGVDPGLAGGLAIIEGNKVISVIDVPVRATKEKNNRNVVDLNALAVWLGAYSAAIRYAIIEDVGVMTGREGVVSMFRFGQAAGNLAGVIAGLQIPLIYVKPTVWKACLALGRNKNESRFMATMIFPESHDKWKRAKDDGRAEAALLAYFGQDRFK